MTENEALRLLKEIAKDSSKIKLTKHARERMEERDISLLQIICCFEYGHITEGPFINMKQNWQVNVSVRTAGQYITTTAALCRTNDSQEYSVVITVMN